MTYSSKIKQLFLELNKVLGVSFENLDAYVDLVIKNLESSLRDEKHLEAFSSYGSQFMRLYKGFFQSISALIEERVEEYEMEKPKVSKSFFIILQENTTTLIDILFTSPESFRTFENSPIEEIIEGFLDSIKDEEHHRALLFLVVYMIRKQTGDDLLGKSGLDT